MGTRSEALAERFESTVRDAVTTVRTLSDADWKKVTEAEQWPVGVVAHHYATVLVPVAELVGALAAGQAPERFTRAKLNEMNAQHARDHAACTKAETLALLETGTASAAAVIRGLSDAQLAKRGTVLTDVPPITVEEVIERVLIAHCEQHFGSIRRTIAP